MPRLLRVLWVLEEREEDDSLTTHACKAKARILTANLERALGGGGGVLALVDCAKNVLEALQRLSESDYDAVIVPVYSTAHDLFFDEVGDLIHDMADPVAVFFFRGVGAMKQKSNDDVEERLRAHRAAVAAAEAPDAARAASFEAASEPATRGAFTVVQTMHRDDDGASRPQKRQRLPGEDAADPLTRESAAPRAFFDAPLFDSSDLARPFDARDLAKNDLSFADIRGLTTSLTAALGKADDVPVSHERTRAAAAPSAAAARSPGLGQLIDAAANAPRPDASAHSSS